MTANPVRGNQKMPKASQCLHPLQMKPLAAVSLNEWWKYCNPRRGDRDRMIALSVLEGRGYVVVEQNAEGLCVYPTPRGRHSPYVDIWFGQPRQGDYLH